MQYINGNNLITCQILRHSCKPVLKNRKWALGTRFLFSRRNTRCQKERCRLVEGEWEQSNTNDTQAHKQHLRSQNLNLHLYAKIHRTAYNVQLLLHFIARLITGKVPSSGVVLKKNISAFKRKWTKPITRSIDVMIQILNWEVPCSLEIGLKAWVKGHNKWKKHDKATRQNLLTVAS